MKDYYNSSIVNDTTIKLRIKGVELDIVVINGTVYRGDVHNNDVLVDRPKFFGDYKSASMYLADDTYIKKYNTKRSLKLLSLSSNPRCVNAIRELFDRYVIDKYKTRGKVLFILLQMGFSLIASERLEIDLMGLTMKQIEKSLQKKFRLSREVIGKIRKILTEYTTDPKIVPSRCSMREVDQAVMRLMRKVLRPMGIDGVWFYSIFKNKDSKDKTSLCLKVNKDMFDIEHSVGTCVPNDMCIFNPKATLDIVKIFHIRRLIRKRDYRDGDN